MNMNMNMNMNFKEFLESYDFKSGIKSIKSKYPDLERLNVTIDEDTMIAEIQLIRIAEKSRGTGIGSNVMKDIINLADEHDMVLTLSPSNDFGISVKALTKFYSKFGFVKNSGKNKYYEANGTMVKTPQF